jgi:peptidoglycan/xylan/chitin deacetylase (PgdA/CDA1 family)
VRRRASGKAGGQPIPILLYHSIDRKCAARYRRWTTSPELFVEHLRWLADHDYRPVTISALAAMMRSGRSIPPRTMAITFDDGLRDFLTEAMPALEQQGFPATLYVATGYVGGTSTWLQPIGEGRRPMLTWEELRLLSDRGIECGAHSDMHPQLDVMAPAAALADIKRSKMALEDRLGREATSFAYPHGYASRTTRRLVQQAGFQSACRVRHAMSSITEHPFALSRIVITSELPTATLAALLSGTGLPLAPRPDRIGSRAWRLVRRLKHATDELPWRRAGPRRFAGADGVQATVSDC